MGIIVRASRAIGRVRGKNNREGVEESALTRRQSWRRQAGGARPNWKSLDTLPFNDGQEYDRPRLEAWLQRCEVGILSKKEKWVWQKLEVNGFRIICQKVSGDENPEEVCMEDILGLLCPHKSTEAEECAIDTPHTKAAYFRRTNLHTSEDASDIKQLVAEVEAEYLQQSGQAPQAVTKPIAMLDHELKDPDFAILTTKMGYYRSV
jgi:hypothetical protein